VHMFYKERATEFQLQDLYLLITVTYLKHHVYKLFDINKIHL